MSLGGYRLAPAGLSRGVSTTGTVDRRGYDLAVADLRAQLAALPAGATVRLGKRTSNLFRTPATGGPRLDVSAFSGVLEVDPVVRTADVLGMTTYEQLVDATLAHGLVPLVVPQLKTITLGGAVTGLGIESSSFRDGTPHESVLEMDVLTGAGEVLHVTPDGPHADLFAGFPNSYGTLGYALRLRIELEPVSPYVHLRHVACGSVGQAAELLRAVCASRSYDGERVHFVDGTWFSPTDVRVTLGGWAQTAPYVSDYTGQQVYYRSVRSRPEDWLTVRDYLWRWDTDWFWCSRVFGVQRPLVRRLWPRRWLRSDVYWRLVAFERRHGWRAAWERGRGLPEREQVVQDVEVPVARLGEFFEGFAREVPIEPVWLCPLRQRDATRSWPLFPLDPLELYVNVGFWSTVALEPDEPDGTHERLVEDLVRQVGGRKSLYSRCFYEPEEFWRLYGGAQYAVLKQAYDPDRRLLDLYDKTVRNR
ncbi:MAG: linked oxidase domain protein [Frankiales bacterium]|nr:linked oxidase domain protein [Frankiales bacterium]